MKRLPKRILVPIDGSAAAARAIDLALVLGAREASELIFCNAVDHAAAVAECTEPYGSFDPMPFVHALDETARSILAQAQLSAKAGGVPATAMLLDGPPANAIVTFARANAIDAIVVGTHGRQGAERLFAGSTAEGVLRATDIPTFVVRGATAIRSFSRILVAVDDADPSLAAASFAFEFARADTAVTLCNVVDTADLIDKSRVYGYDPAPMLEELRAASRALLDHSARVAERSARVDSAIVEGGPVEGILDAAATCGADLIAIGTHGRRGLRRLFLGSVAEGVVRRSPVPVVVLRAPHQRS